MPSFGARNQNIAIVLEELSLTPEKETASSSEVLVVILFLDTVLYANDDAVSIDHGGNISYHTEHHSFELHVLLK